MIRNLYSDQNMLAALRTGDKMDEAIRQLYRTQYTQSAAYVKQNSGNDQDAEDIFQEVVLTFIELVKKEKFRGDSSISTFLYAITRNTWLNELKKRGRTSLRDEKFEKNKATTDMDISHHIAGRELREQLMGLVDSLGKTCKEILIAFYFENQTMKDILANLDYENEQVVRNKKYKCLKQLTQLITDNTHLSGELKTALKYE